MPSIVAGLALALAGAVRSTEAVGLEETLGRSEVRVRSAPYFLVRGRTVAGCGLVERLERLGYQRTHDRPDREGRFFYGHRRFWIYRHAHRWDGRDYPASLIGLELRPEDGMILGAVGVGGERHDLEREGLLWLEPETLSESLDGDRADRIRIRFETLPEHAWQALLAAEDARFFDHAGVDARAIARAALANVKRGKVSQGGSTLTQQLVKNRDLTPRRSLGRKASEAVRALLLEAEYDKIEILEAYLNQVYYGHVDGMAVHGIGTAARVYFSKPASSLTLGESALLAAMVQGPNALSPLRHPERARKRRDWVLERLEELAWVEPGRARRARAAGLGLASSPPRSRAPSHFLSWTAELARDRAGERLGRRGGVVVETTLDPRLQAIAERAVRTRLDRLRRSHRRLRAAPLTAALVALDARDGAVRAYVGGDPAAGRDGFDRARQARRQVGSTVKPLVLLEAFESCGSRPPLHPATRVADEPLQVRLPSGTWAPENYDRKFRGVIDLRTALAESRNVPMVRVAGWCGVEGTARRIRRTGLDLEDNPPLSFVLGSSEATPLQLAAAYTVLATPGSRLEPLPIRRVERPGGDPVAKLRPRGRRVVRPSTAHLVRDLMRSAVEAGTASAGAIDGVDVAAKTGSTSGLRDAWFAGHGGSLVTVVWVGLDEGTLGLTGAAAAGPIWRAFMSAAVPAYDGGEVEPPSGVVRHFVDPRTGLRVGAGNRHGKPELFRRGALPRRDRFWRIDRPEPVVR